ncbi:unnamed protein product [Aureobasidium uvarum]|uniref:Uncharacterized protein n=1 Tax=Aureobasidium uvarum TaxID=2773716 RepID=A0A9N8PST0_9PEZI|nr:unnamed protein product [Aureobasidium uvarum]
MDHHTWNRFSCLLDAPVDPCVEAIKHWQYVHTERSRVDNLLAEICDDSDTFDASESWAIEQEAIVAELYRHLDEVYNTFERGDHSKFVTRAPSTKKPSTPAPIPKYAFKEWRKQCWKMSEKSELIRNLPRPPFIPCSKVGCDNTLASFKSCVHSLETLYRNAELNHKELIKERNFWHPDRWSRVPQPHRQEVERMAILVFQALQPLCDRVK